MKSKLYCIIGRTSSGKSSLTRIVADELGSTVIQSYTTRSARPNEIDNPNADHIFVSDDRADELLKKETICAYTEINGNRYFATLSQILFSDLYVIDCIGFNNLKERLNQLDVDIELVPIYIKSDTEIRRQRYAERINDTLVNDFDKRNSSESEQFDLFEMTYKGVVIENNGDIQDAINEFKKVVMSYEV